MKKSGQRDESVCTDLFANGISVEQGGNTESKLTKNHEGERFQNAYAEASQARSSGRRPCAPHHGNSRGFDQSFTAGKDQNGKIERSPADNRSQKDNANSESVKPSPGDTRTVTANVGSAVVSRMMSATEVAGYLGVSASKVWRLETRENSFPHPVRIGGSTRWDRQAIDRYLDNLQNLRKSGR